MEMFAFIVLLMMLLYLAAIKFPVPYTPLEGLQLSQRLLFLHCLWGWRFPEWGIAIVLGEEDFLKFFFFFSL